jgi:hypothetical protein
MWYRHKFDLPIITQPNGLYSVQVVDSLGSTISSSHYKLYPDSGAAKEGIYTDLINTPDLWYYVVYLTTSGAEVRRLLSVTPIFSDISKTGGTLIGKTFKTNYSTLYNTVEITTPEANHQYSLMAIGTTKIAVKHPVQAADEDPWYVQITNGYFRKYVTDGSDVNVYEYYLPEYAVQTWNPSRPDKSQFGEAPIFLDNDLVRLRQTPLSNSNIRTGSDINPAENVRVYLRASSERSNEINELINAAGGKVDTAPYLGNETTEGWWELIIDGIDRNTGLIRVKGIRGKLDPSDTDPTDILTGDDAKIYASDTLIAFYYYEELEYTFKKINLNPIQNRQLLTSGVSIYMRPPAYKLGSAASIPASTTVDYLMFDKDQKIIKASDTSVVLGGALEDFYAAGATEEIPGVGYNQTLLLEIARIFVRNTALIRDITDENLVDTRQQGGLLIEDLPQEVIDLINRSTNDMYELRNWDGIVLPGNSVVIIKVPSYLLNDNWEADGTLLIGDALTRRMIDIRNLCKKHLASGVLPIVRFYDNATREIVETYKPPLDRRYF